MKSLYLAGWLITRVFFVALFALAEPIGHANVWLKQKWLAA